MMTTAWLPQGMPTLFPDDGQQPCDYPCLLEFIDARNLFRWIAFSEELAR